MGDVYVMEASSMLPIAALLDAFPEGPPEGMKIFDASAAPGGKTTALATWVAPVQGGVLANDNDARRTSKLVDNLLRTGTMPWVAVSQVDGQFAGKFWPETFDAVLLDAPCTGESQSATREGALPKDDKMYTNESYINRLTNTQKCMAASAVQVLKVGGVLVYSTCTLNPAQNEEVMDHIERKFGDAIERMPLDGLKGTEKMRTEEGFLRCWPQLYDTEGFFVARFRKVKPTEADGMTKANTKKAGMFLHGKDRQRRNQKGAVKGEIYRSTEGVGTIGKGLDTFAVWHTIY